MYPVFKRLFDLVVSAGLLLILAPLCLPLMLILRLSGEGEIFYLQERIGLGNRPFNIWKFATMLKDSPNLGHGDITVRNDPRILPLGGILRRTKLNELPQLLNVLKGDMSLVGPRPLMKVSFLRYPPEAQKALYEVKPGITGIASIVFRDEETLISRSSDFESTYRRIADCKARLESWYRGHLRFGTDISILILTLLALVEEPRTLLRRAYRVFPDLPRVEADLFEGPHDTP